MTTIWRTRTTPNKTYTDEFRKAAVARVANGEKVSKVALELGLHESLIPQWKKRYEKIAISQENKLQENSMSQDIKMQDSALQDIARNINGPRANSVQIVEAIERHKNGESYAILAKDYGRHRDTIRRWCDSKVRERHANAVLKYMNNKRSITLRLKKHCLSLYLEPWQSVALKRLSARTRVPQQVFIREGLCLVLEKYKKTLNGSSLKFANFDKASLYALSTKEDSIQKLSDDDGKFANSDGLVYLLKAVKGMQTDYQGRFEELKSWHLDLLHANSVFKNGN